MVKKKKKSQDVMLDCRVGESEEFCDRVTGRKLK